MPGRGETSAAANVERILGKPSGSQRHCQSRVAHGRDHWPPHRVIHYRSRVQKASVL